MAMDGDCMDPVGMAGGPDEEPPSKKPRTKIIPYKLKESDKKMVYDSGKLKGIGIVLHKNKKEATQLNLQSGPTLLSLCPRDKPSSSA